VDTVAARIGAAAEGFTLAEWRLREAGGSRDIYSLLCVPGAGETGVEVEIRGYNSHTA